MKPSEEALKRFSHLTLEEAREHLERSTVQSICRDESAYVRSRLGLDISPEDLEAAYLQLFPILFVLDNRGQRVITDPNHPYIEGILAGLNAAFPPSRSFQYSALTRGNPGPVLLTVLNKARESCTWVETQYDDVPAFVAKIRADIHLF